MSAIVDDAADPRPPPDRLAEALAASAEPVFSVVDGAQFDDLPSLLRAAGLFARSLFLDHADAAVEQAGPWLVPLERDEDARRRLLTVVGDKPALVAWTSTAGEPALYRHLRTLNRARIPAWAAQGGAEPPPGEAASGVRAYEAVLFRHWDPRVLAGLLPVLDAGQFRRMLGPASGLLLHAADYGGLKRIIVDPAWPPSPAGLLTVRSEQVAMMMQRRALAADLAIVRYLREVAPEDTAALSDGLLRERVVAYRASATRMGLIEESTIAQWAYMMISTADQFEAQPRVRSYVLRGPSTPDRNLDRLIAEMLQIARAEEREGR